MPELFLPTAGVLTIDHSIRDQLQQASKACRKWRRCAEAGNFAVASVEAPAGSPTEKWRRGQGNGPKYSCADARLIRNVYTELSGNHGRGRAPVVFSAKWVCELHGKLAKHVDRQKATAGRFRTRAVNVGAYVAPRAEEIAERFRGLVDFANHSLPALREQFEGDSIAAGIARSALVHADFLKLHPFGDGNGRTARAIDFALLLDAGVPPQIAQLMLRHYTGTRFEYCKRLAAVERDGVMPFLSYAAVGLTRELEGDSSFEVLLGRRQLLRAGYTLLELMAVMTILGTVAAFAIPKIAGSAASARQVVERLDVKQIQTAIQRYRLTYGVWPSSLDSAANTVSSPSNPLFADVLQVGETSGNWSKMDSVTYTGPTGTSYQLDTINGLFVETSGGGSGSSTDGGDGGTAATGTLT